MPVKCKIAFYDEWLTPSHVDQAKAIRDALGVTTKCRHRVKGGTLQLYGSDGDGDTYICHSCGQLMRLGHMKPPGAVRATQKPPRHSD